MARSERRRYDCAKIMSIKVTYKDGIFEPIEDVKGVRPGQHFTVSQTIPRFPKSPPTDPVVSLVGCSVTPLAGHIGKP